MGLSLKLVISVYVFERMAEIGLRADFTVRLDLVLNRWSFFRDRVEFECDSTKLMSSLFSIWL